MSTNKTFNKVQLDVKFTQATTRANLISEENISISFGKISKYFADLHSQAFTGYTHPTYTARTGKPTGNQTPGFGSTFTISQITSDGTGHVTAATDRTVKIPDTTMGAASADAAGSKGLVPAPAAGKQTSFLRGDGTWAVPTNTDTKVTQSQTTTTNYRPILFGAKNSTDVSTLADTITDQAYTSTKMFAKPDTGILYASGFSTSGYTNGTGAQLAQYGLYLKSYKSASLPAGGDYSYSRYALRVYDGKSTDNAGMLLEICGGGLTIVGAGESASSLAALISDDQRDSNTSRTRLNVGGTLNTSFSGSVEQLILSSDNNIYFLTKCNTIADRKPVVLDTNSYFYPGTTKTGSIGTSSYMWNSVYAATIYENGTSLASKYAAIGHTHTTTIAADSGTNQLTLAASTKYKLTAGETNFIFTTPPNTTYSAGTGLSLSGTTINHSNSVTARTNYNARYVKYDAQGHVTGASYWTATASGTDGEAGWIKIATIVHTKTYDNTPIMLFVSQRGNTITYRLHIVWKNANNTDPDLDKFYLVSDESTSAEAYIIKSATSTWDLYIKKIDSYEAVGMHLYVGKYFTDHMTWTWQDVQTAASAITGGTTATEKNYYNTQTSRAANTVLAAPNGSNGGATFRKLVAADIPSLNYSKVSISRNLTSGTKVGTITIDGTSTDLYCQTNTNTDTLVSQTFATADKNRPLLMSYYDTGVQTTTAQIVHRNDALYFNPSSGILRSPRLYLQTPDMPITINLHTLQPTAGKNVDVLSVKYKNTDGTATHTVFPIGILGNDATGSGATNNSGVRLGSTNGTTIVGAGESSTTFAAAQAKYNDENLYFVADGAVYMYTNCSNDSTTVTGPWRVGGFTTGTSAITSGRVMITDGTTGGFKASDYTIAKSVPSDAKFSDTVTTVTTSGSGNAVTSITASNGALTVTKGSTFSLSTHTHNYAGSSSAGGAANSANVLNYNNSVTATTSGLQYTHGGITIGTADGNSKEGSDPSYKLWSYPAGGTVANSTSANIQNLRLYWSSAYFRDIFLSPNNDRIYHRAVINNSAKPWYVLLDSNNLETYSLHTPDTAKALSLDTGQDMSPITRPQNLYNRSNKLALIPGSNITVEYSTDAGSNWTDMGLTADKKGNLFNDTISASIPIGPNDSTDRTTSMQTRITITCDGRDQTIDQYILWLNSSYQTISIDLQVAYGNATTTFTNIRTGLSCPPWKYQYILNTETKRFGTNTTSAYVNKIRFVIKYTGINGSYKTSKAIINSIAGYSGIYWGGAVKNNLMIYDHLYTWDNSQNATFPAQLNATGATFTSSSFGPLKIVRSGSTNAAGIKFYNNTSTYLGSLGINTANSRFLRWNTDDSTSYEIIDRSVVSSTPSAKVNTNWNTTTDRTTVVTKGWMSFWDGAYNGSTSNLTYCNQGAFGTIVTKSATDYSKVASSTTNGKIKIDGTDTTVYTHPSHTSKTSGLYKITVDTLGHVSATASVAKGDIPALDYLPLAGGTMTGDIVYPHSDGRSSTMTNSGMTYKIAQSNNWAMGLTYVDSGETHVGFIGAYGTTDAFESIRFGAKYNDWWMKITNTETTITGDLVFSTVTSTTYPAESKKIKFGGGTDWGRIYYRVDAADAGRLVLDIGDDSNARIDFAYNGTTKSYIDTSGNFSGNAATSSSWATARTLTLSGQLTGSVSVKGDANMTLSGWLKKSLIYDETSDFASYAWHKFAEKTITGKNEDQTITFIVSKTWGNVPKCSGILTAHIRTGSTKVYESSQFYWQLANSEINPEDFVFVYTNTADTSCEVELWYKQTGRYDGWIFTVLKEHSRTSNNNVWTLYTSAGHGSASHTTGTNSYASSITDIKNNTSGTSSNVTGTVAIANGGTGATTRLNALKNLTNEAVGTSATYFLTITDSWGKGGYSSVANVKTVLGLKSAAYTESSDYVPNTQAGVSDAINLLSTGSSTPSLTDYYVAQYVNGGTTTTSYHRRPISALWNAFKGLITLATTGTGNAVTAVSIANDGDNNRKITVTKGSTFSLSTHTHNYAGSSSAGGPATNVAIARVTKDSKVFPGSNKVVFEEYTNGTNYNLPSNHFYHIMSAQGNDAKYGTQLALGMTTTAAYYRSYNNQTWSDWKSIINSNTYDRNRYNGNIKAGSSALVAANIIVGKDGVYKHLKSGGAFDITYPILYLAGAVDANGTTSNTYDIINFTITTTQSLTLTAYRPVYIRGTLNGTVFTPINTTPLTQTIITYDTYDYIYLGQATSSTTVYLQERHPIYSHRNGRVQEITPCASMAATSDGFVAPMIKKLYDNSATSTNYITISDVNIDDYEFFIICVTDGPKTDWVSAATQWIPAREGNHHFMINNGAAPNQGGGYIHCTDGSVFISKTGTNKKDLQFTLCRPAEAISTNGSSVTTDNFPNTRIMRVYGVKAF